MEFQRLSRFGGNSTELLYAARQMAICADEARQRSDLDEELNSIEQTYDYLDSYEIAKKLELFDIEVHVEEDGRKINFFNLLSSLPKKIVMQAAMETGACEIWHDQIERIIRTNSRNTG